MKIIFWVSFVLYIIGTYLLSIIVDICTSGIKKILCRAGFVFFWLLEACAIKLLELPYSSVQFCIVISCLVYTVFYIIIPLVKRWVCEE